jgi:hypothetical protein
VDGGQASSSSRRPGFTKLLVKKGHQVGVTPVKAAVGVEA